MRRAVVVALVVLALSADGATGAATPDVNGWYMLFESSAGDAVNQTFDGAVAALSGIVKVRWVGQRDVCSRPLSLHRASRK